MKTQTITTATVLAIAFGLAGCASTPTTIDTGPIPARTFSFVDTGGKALPDFAEKRQQIHTLFQDAITQSLARRQVSRVEKGGDITVAYLIVTGDNAVTTSINDFFGYSEDLGALLDKAHSKYTAGKNPNYFEAGTLLIDIIDSKSWKVLKRGHASRELLRNPSPDEQAARVSEVVEEIFADARFKQ